MTPPGNAQSCDTAHPATCHAPKPWTVSHFSKSGIQAAKHPNPLQPSQQILNGPMYHFSIKFPEGFSDLLLIITRCTMNCIASPIELQKRTSKTSRLRYLLPSEPQRPVVLTSLIPITPVRIYPRYGHRLMSRNSTNSSGGAVYEVHNPKEACEDRIARDFG